MAAVLPDHEMQERVARQSMRAARSRARAGESTYQFVRPLLGAALDLWDEMANPESRFTFGLPELDEVVGGIARGELCYLTGRAHSGKTYVALHSIVSNPQRHILYLTPDETDRQIVAKLAAITRGYDYAQLDAAVKAEDREVLRMLMRVAEDDFPNLVVIDYALSFDQMTVALHEAQDKWQADCEALVVDYLDLLPGEADYSGTKAKSTHLKRWVKQRRLPALCLHQPKRSGAWRGQRIGMDDMHMGGETEATFVLGVFRKRDDSYAEELERARHRDTLSVYVDKNKRSGKDGEFDFFLHPRTGMIRPLRPEDMVTPGAIIESATIAAAARDTAKREAVTPLHLVT